MKRHTRRSMLVAVLLLCLPGLLNACQPIQRLPANQAPSSISTGQEATNKALVQRFYDEVFTQKKMEVLGDLFAENFVPHDLDAHELPAGLEETIAGFPDLKATITQWVVQGDFVTAMVTFAGTQQAEFLGVAPTGKAVTFSIIDIWRVQDGKITELWHDVPNNEILEQIGGAPATATLKNPIDVVQAFYTLMNAKQYDAALLFVADDAVFAEPDGKATGKEAIRQHFMQAAASGFTAETSNFKVNGDKVTYSYKVLQGGSVIATGDDGVDIVRNGKIVFDGFEPNSSTISETVANTTTIPISDTNPAKPDDATQGRLRISNCVFAGPSVDWLLNGKLTVNGGLQQTNLGALDVGGYQYLSPGTYSVAIVPTGEGLDKALLGPLDVTIVAGHRYTLAMLGQANEQHTPLLIDETEAYQKAGLNASTWGEIAINNVKNSTSLSFIQDDAGVKDVPYGGFVAAAMPAGTFKDFKVTISGGEQPDIEANGAGFNLAGSDQLDCFAGIYPNGHDTHTAATTSLLNPIDFLQVTSDGFAQVGHPELGFTSFLAALKMAGLTEELTQGGPYLLFAPTDAAFAALPKDQREALMADPQALIDLIHTHLIQGYFPYGTMGPIHQGFNRTVTNMQGEQFKVTGDDSGLLINGKAMGETSGTFVANGTRVMSVQKLLLPDTK